MGERLWRIEGEPVPAMVLGRPNRFVLEVDRGAGAERAHLSNPGELAGLVEPGATVLCRPVEDDDRATALDVLGAEADDALVYLPSADANRAVEQVVERNLVDRFAGYTVAATEPRVEDGSRLDFRLRREADGAAVDVEVKSVTHAEDGVAKFPDRPTERGRRHLRHLVDQVAAGGNAMLVFVVPRSDAVEVRPYREVDPAFADLLEEARTAGVALHALTLEFTGEAVRLDDPDVPVAVGG